MALGNSGATTTISAMVSARKHAARMRIVNASGLCQLALVRQSSHAPCTLNATFGCRPGRLHEFWVSNGCRGLFMCAGKRIPCGDYKNPATPCNCRQVLRRSPSSGSKPRRQRQAPPAAIALLIALVADSSLMTQRRMLVSMRAVDSTHAEHLARVDWSVVAYDDGASLWEGTQQHARSLRHVELVAVLNASVKHPSIKHAKPLAVEQRKARWAHQLLLLRHLMRAHHATFDGFQRQHQQQHHQYHPHHQLRPPPQARHYDAVWFPDDDLTFASFDLAEYLRRWLCVFPGGPPIVSQPPLRPSRSAARGNESDGGVPRVLRRRAYPARVQARMMKPFQNDARTYSTCVVGELAADSNFGNESCFLRDALALRTAFVEGQAALLDAGFLRWFMELPLASKIAKLQLKMRVEAGNDAIWCAG